MANSQSALDETVEKTPLLEILSRYCPGIQVEAFTVHGVYALRFEKGSQKVWVVLEDRPRPKAIEEGLGVVAHKLVYCQRCANDPDLDCFQDYAVTSRNLRRLLGEAAYEALLANAPIRRSAD